MNSHLFQGILLAHLLQTLRSEFFYLRKNYITLFLCLLLPFFSWTHESHVSYFKVSVDENRILIDAEFPWTLRNAVFEFDSSLIGTKNKQLIDKAVEDYFKENIKLFSEDRPLALLKVQEVKVGNHSHAVNYRIAFAKDKLNKIQNTCLFNIYPNAINYHEVVIEDSYFEFETKLQSPAIYLSEVKEITHHLEIGFMLIVMVCIGLLGCYLMKSK